jgi:regulatory protein
MNEQEAIRKAMALCSKKEYSSGEIIEKLKLWEVSGEKIPGILENLIREKFVDDSRYAAAFVNDKLKFSKWGKIKIAYMLRHKGIPDNIIEDSLSEIDQEKYMELLISELRKKFKTLKPADDYELKGKLIQFATGRGFEFDIASKAALAVIKS